MVIFLISSKISESDFFGSAICFSISISERISSFRFRLETFTHSFKDILIASLTDIPACDASDLALSSSSDDSRTATVWIIGFFSFMAIRDFSNDVIHCYTFNHSFYVLSNSYYKPQFFVNDFYTIYCCLCSL